MFSPPSYSLIKSLFTFLLFCYFCPSLRAQSAWIVQKREADGFSYKTIYQKEPKDSMACKVWLKQYLAYQTEKGYLTLKMEYDTAQAGKVLITLGTQHIWEDVRSQNLPTKPEKWKGKPFSIKAIQTYQQKVLRYAETIGYPFAQIRLDSLVMQAGKWRGKWLYEPRLYVTFDSLSIVGKVKTNAKFLRQYLRLQVGQAYNQSKIDAIQSRLQRLPYLRLEKTPETRFMKNKALVLLTLKTIKANQIDGILGILPNENKRGEVLLTGELNALFYNVFTQGHSFKMQWQRLQTLSQRLEIETAFQTLFNTPLQLQAGIKFLKQDSSFVNRQWELRLGYATQGNHDFFAQIINQKTNLGNAAYLYENTQLPNISETKWQGYGLGYKAQTTDDVFFPRKGLICNFSIYTGVKQIIKNPFLADALYQDLILKTPQTLAQIDVQAYLQVGKGVFKWGMQGAYLANKQLFLNELMRIGGLASLRGHNQNAFFASQYFINTIEYRLPLDASSYLFAFYDQAYFEQRLPQNFQSDLPTGIGIGANLSLKAGVFSLAYALGQAKDTPFAFNRAKIHFGVISKF